jgi:AcrR family transcriptional regulator
LGGQLDQSKASTFEAFEDQAEAPAGADRRPSHLSPLERRRELQRDALALFAYRPPGAVTIRELTRACQVSPNSVYGWYGDLPGLYRQALKDEMRALSRDIQAATFECASPREAIAAFAEWTAEMLRTPRHRHLLYLVVRDRAEHDWLSPTYLKAVLEPLEAKLSQIVRAAGRRMDMRLEIAPGEGRHFIDRLFAEFSMAELLPRERTPSKREAKAVFDDIVARAVAAVGEAETLAGSLAGLISPGSATSAAKCG